MAAIVVVVMDELGLDRAQVALTEGYQLVEALVADGPHPALRDRVGARRPDRRPQILMPSPVVRWLKSAAQTRSRSWTS